MSPEDEPLVARHLGHFGQAVVRLDQLAVVEVLEPRDPFQRPVDAVGPAVVGAQEALGVALLGPAHRVAPVRTGVQQRLDGPVLLPHDQHVVPAHDRGEEVARLGDLRLVAQELPRAAEDPLHLQLEDLRVAVDPPGHLAALERHQVVELVHRNHHAAPLVARS